MTSKSGSGGGAAEDGSYEYEEEFVNNARGMKLFTCRWLPPKGHTVKGQVFLCHGNTSIPSFFFLVAGGRPL
jgi:hypothetical protein